MPSVPLSVRTALWTTAYLQGQVDDMQAWQRSHPGVTESNGYRAWATEWHDSGETVAIPVLPRPGRPGWLSVADGSGRVGLDAATNAGEAVVGARVGSVAVPVIQEYGPEGDRGVMVTWTAYPGMPVPRHRLEATDLRDLAQRLAATVRQATETLEHVGGAPWRATDVLAVGRFGGAERMPKGCPARAMELIIRGTLVAEAAEAGLAVEKCGAAFDSSTSQRRAFALREVAGVADEVVEGAGTLAAITLAGWRAP